MAQVRSGFGTAPRDVTLRKGRRGITPNDKGACQHLATKKGSGF